MARFQFIKDLSIKNKIIAIILFIAFTAISIGFIFITIMDINRLKTETQSHLSLDATLIGDYCIVPLTFGDKQQAVEALSRLRYIESVDQGYLFDASGNLFATYPDSLKKPVNTALDEKRSAVFTDGHFHIKEPISFENTSIGTLYLKANSELLTKETQKLAILFSLVFLIMLIISYLLAVRLQKLFTKPILKLADMTAAISLNQDFTLQLEPYGKDEIGFLYQQFNNLLSQLLKRQNERDKAEKEISFLAQVLRNINEFVSITDTENNISFVNQSWLKTFGYSEKEVIGQKIDIIVSPSNRLGIIEDILSTTLKGGWQGEVLNRRKDGSEFPVRLVTTIIYDKTDQPVSLVGISHDITYRKKTEEELKIHREHLEELVVQRTAELEIEKEHAQSADRLKSAFLATMSHELRTPLNSIIGFTGILMKEAPGPLNNEQKKQLGMAQNSARHLLSLINDVLDISKIEAGQLKMNLEQFNLPEVIYKVVETNRPFADKKNLRIMVYIDDDVKDITSDNLRVQQVLLNLVNNAIKFTEVGTISIKCFSVRNFIKIQITDSGMGIEKGKIEQLFKPFMQIDTGLTRKHEGTGLGLSICKKLTEMLNGTIEVDSKYGSGSTFTVTLPIINT
jgi:PAS domain S-box-containing protein